jgi:hypothetical protein
MLLLPGMLRLALGEASHAWFRVVALDTCPFWDDPSQNMLHACLLLCLCLPLQVSWAWVLRQMSVCPHA